MNGTLDTHPSQDADEIAVIGLSCRFPGDASTPERFWEMLSNGRSSAKDVPHTRWANSGYHFPQRGRRNTVVTPKGHFLSGDIAAFDAEFFHINHAEALAMDPQQRIMLEVAYETFENAGLPIEVLSGSKTACFVGAFTSDWREMQFRDLDSAPVWAVTGSGVELLANRTSWFYDLRGPSMTVNTACSASMVSLHLACQNLRSGEASMALVGGANLFLSPEVFALLSNQNFLSPEGICKSFDASGNGYSRGEGVAAILLKPVRDAIRDGDTIRAVIRGTGSNQDGKTPTIAMPSSAAQVDLIRTTYRAAGLEPGATHYCEAHGTGTAAGDPAETGAIAEVLCEGRDPSTPLYVGSVKTNVGHLESVAGLAGVIKSILILEAGVIPASLNFKQPNPKIAFEKWNIKIPTHTIPWPYPGPRRASVNSFGYGGANAHVILEDAYHYLSQRNLTAEHRTLLPAHHYSGLPISTSFTKQTNGTAINGCGSSVGGSYRHSDQALQPRLLLPLSSHDEEGIGRMRAALSDYLGNPHQKGDPKDDSVLRDLAYTLCKRRSRFHWKSFHVASSLSELRETLNSNSAMSGVSTRQPKIGFVFTGQGAQWARMGLELCRYDRFRQRIEEADAYLRDQLHCPWSAVQELGRDESETKVHQPLYSQPLCTIVQVALVDLLESWNITPVSVVGHSSGEIAAAYCLGALNRRDAWKAAYYRGLLCSQQPSTLKGSMMAVGASRTQAMEFINKATIGGGVCTVGCVNSPNSVTLSGDAEAVEEVRVLLQQEGIFARPLKVQAAYHSHHMANLAGPYFEVLSDMEAHPAQEGRRMFSSVLGRPIAGEELGAMNWVRNLVSPVLFADAVSSLAATDGGVDLFIEVGPHPALRGPVTQQIGEVQYLSTLSRGTDAISSMLDLAGKAFIQGVPVALAEVNGVGSGRLLTDLPPYPWNHTRTFWSESRIAKTNRLRQNARGSLLGAPYAPVTHNGRLWRGFIRTAEEPWIRDHEIQSSIVYPAAGFLAMAIEALRQVAIQDEQKAVSAYILRDIHITTALVLTDASDAECIIELRPVDSSGGPWHHFSIASSLDGTILQEHCSGQIMTEVQPATGSSSAAERLLEDQARVHVYEESHGIAQQRIDENAFYDTLSSIGLKYGPTFRNARNIRVGEWICRCSVVVPRDLSSPAVSAFERPHIIHPTLLDAMFHASFAASLGAGVNEAAVPSFIREVAVAADMPYSRGSVLHGQAQTRRHGYSAFMSDLDFLDDSCTKSLVKITGLKLVNVGTTGSRQHTPASTKSTCSQLVWTPVLSLMPEVQSPSAIQPLREVAESIKGRESDQRDDDFSAVVAHAVERALDSVKPDDVPTNELRELYRWLYDKKFSQAQSIQERICPKGSANANSPPTTESSNLLPNFLSNLEAILRGELDAVDLNLHDAAAAIGHIMEESVLNFLEILKRFALLKPDAEVLLLDLGFDDSTRRLLRSVYSQTDSLNLCSVVLTHATTVGTTVEEIKEEFPGISSQMLDLGEDLAAQSFCEASFDAIMITGGIGVSDDINTTLSNIKRLLRPRGSLYMSQITTPRLSSLPSLLTYPPIWSSNNIGPFAASPKKSWLSALAKNGFHVDFTSPEGQQTTLFAASILRGRLPDVGRVTILQPVSPSVHVQELATGLTVALKDLSIAVDIVSWIPEYTPQSHLHYISLLELDSDVVATLTEREFYQLQQLILSASTILWVTGFGQPENELVTGLARTVKNEVATVSFSVLHVAGEAESYDKTTSSTIAKLFVSSAEEDEYLLRDNVLYTNRVVEDAATNDNMTEMLHHKTSREMSLGESPVPLMMRIGAPGLLDTLGFQADKAPALPLGDDEVEIDVKATGVNFRDVMVCMGQIPDNLLGFEASGLVRRVGSNVTRIRPGDAVCVLGHGAHRTVLRTKALMCQHMPDGMPFDVAAGLPLVHCTAYHAIVNVARLRKGQSVLIHAAAGGVGQAAVQLAKHLGLEVYATVGSAEKRRLIRDLYEVEDDHIFNSRDLSFAKGVMRMTKERGVDCVLNSLSGEALRQSWNCIAPFGTFVEIGIKDILANSPLEMRPFIQDATFSFLNLEHVQRRRPEMMGEIMEQTFSLLRQGVVRGVQPQNTYPVSNVKDAFRLMQSGKHQGKICLTFSPEDRVPVELDPGDAIDLSNKGTYVLVGGLGGLGRSLAKLLAQCGAKYLCFISRSGSLSEPSAAALVSELQAFSVNVMHYRCDISDEAALHTTLEICGRDNPPISGVIQCAMVLRDGLFANMSYRDWVESLAPKVAGTRNLSKAMPATLDFFLLLSSFSGIFGNMGQSNYAAGCTYQDGIAHSMRSIDRKAVSIDLGIMRDVGVLAEQGAKSHHLREWEEPFGIREDEFHALIKTVIAAASAGNIDLLPTQIITGLATGASVVKAGISEPFYLARAKFGPLRRAGLQAGSSTIGNEKRASVADELSRVDSLAGATKLVQTAVVDKVATILATASTSIDTQRPMHDYGVDSLVALEVSNWISNELQAIVSVFDLLKSMPIASLCDEIARKSQLVSTEVRL